MNPAGPTRQPAPRLAIAGIDGRVGQLLVRQIAKSGLNLVGGIGRGGDLAALATETDVVIDFTEASTTATHAAILAAAGTAWVLGTTGLDMDAEAAIAAAATRIGIVQAANFSPGVVLMHDLARRLAAALPPAQYDAEIVEMHHRDKLDAPSGTALSLGHAVAGARGVTLDTVRSDARSGRRVPGAIGFASLRGGAIVGEHALSFTADQEQITLSHRAFDRGVFAAGALQAALWVAGRPPSRYAMEDVLGLR